MAISPRVGDNKRADHLVWQTQCPYSVTRQEIVQFVGRDARIISTAQGYPVHIIMERSTAKTMDCYVEFQTISDAERCVKKLNNVLETGRPARLGNRHVDVSLSSEDSLLRDLFSRAKCVVWKKGFPHLTANNDPYSTGFKGFLTREEILGVIRHAEQPHRVCSKSLFVSVFWQSLIDIDNFQSPFSQKCPQRTYESMISTVWKVNSKAYRFPLPRSF